MYNRDVFQDAYHSFMPSYQDYVVARDDIDPNTPAGGAARAAAATEKGGGEKQSRVVRTRTFLIGNLDRPTGGPSASSTAGTQVTFFFFFLVCFFSFLFPFSFFLFSFSAVVVVVMLLLLSFLASLFLRFVSWIFTTKYINYLPTCE